MSKIKNIISKLFKRSPNATDAPRYINIKQACEEIMQRFIEGKPGWRYLKTKRTFSYKIPKGAFIDIDTGMSNKSDFVTFQFSIHVGHKEIGKAMEMIYNMKDTINWIVGINDLFWAPKDTGYGNCIVFQPRPEFLTNFEQARKDGSTSYVYLNEFEERLAILFTAAEKKITEIFDTTSEIALINSIIEKPIGYFDPFSVLVVQLMLDNPAYYDELVDFYDRPHEELVALKIDMLNQQHADMAMARYRDGTLPKFSFISNG